MFSVYPRTEAYNLIWMRELKCRFAHAGQPPRNSPCHDATNPASGFARRQSVSGAKVGLERGADRRLCKEVLTMRIAQIAPLDESVPPKLYGGTERVVSYLTEELVRQGHQVTLFASEDSS
jgi:hypothetical protein